MIVAGGTDVIFNMRLKLFDPEVALSIRGIEELRSVEELADGSLRIGAGARLADLVERPGHQRAVAGVCGIDSRGGVHAHSQHGHAGRQHLSSYRCSYTNNSEEWRKGLKDCYKTEGQLCHVIRSSDSCLAINNADTPVALIMHGASLTIRSVNGTRDVPDRRSSTRPTAITIRSSNRTNSSPM